MLLFEDDGTPIEWTEIHRSVWGGGHKDAQIDLECPFPENSAYALCWEAGFNTCKGTGNHTPAGRKRKPCTADFNVQKDGVTIGVVGRLGDFRKLQERTELPLLPGDRAGLHMIHTDGVEVLLEALRGE
jgi:hypothetical protein